MKWRLMFSIPLAIMLTTAIFLFMLSLIHGPSKGIEHNKISGVVELYQPPEKPEEPKKQIVKKSEVKPRPKHQEPDMKPLAINTAPSITPGIIPKLPSLNMASPQLPTGGGIGGTGSANIVGNGKELMRKLDLGQDNQGYITITPYSTRRPNIPQLAWEKKINGWVLVVFKVTPAGTTKDVMVLDSHPKGVFEDKVVDAVNQWRYSVKDLKKQKGNLVLTQKINLFWKNYPQNVKWLDKR